MVFFSRLFSGIFWDLIYFPGWSFGGVVAFEVAKQLRVKSKLVELKGVILIDSPNPLNHVPLSSPLIEDVIDNSIKGNHSDAIREFCKSQFITNAKLLSEYDPFKIVVNNYDSEGLPRLRLVCLVCRDGYNSPSCVDVPSWLTDRGDITTIPKGWELVSGPGSVVQALDIPGHHFEPFQLHNVSAFRLFFFLLFYFFFSKLNNICFYFSFKIVTVSTRIAEACEMLEKEIPNLIL